MGGQNKKHKNSKHNRPGIVNGLYACLQHLIRRTHLSLTGLFGIHPCPQGAVILRNPAGLVKQGLHPQGKPFTLTPSAQFLYFQAHKRHDLSTLLFLVFFIYRP
jgi:hypothetical protein